MTDKPDFTAMSGDQLLAWYNETTGAGRKSKFHSKPEGVAACEDAWTSREEFIPKELRRVEAAGAVTGRLEPKDFTADMAAAQEQYGAQKKLESWVKREADLRWRNWVPTAKELHRPRVGTFARRVRDELKAKARAEKAAAKKPDAHTKMAQELGISREAAKVKNFATAYGSKKPELAGAPPVAQSKLKGTTGKGARVIRLLREANPRRAGTAAYAHYEKMVGSPTVAQYAAKFPEADRKTAMQWLANTVRDGYAELLG